MNRHAADAPGANEDGNRLRQLRMSEALALLLIVGAGALARLYHIGWQSLWMDEGFSEWASRQSLWYLWSVLPTFEPHPPFYYTLLKGWRGLFGDSETALRSLSALFGVATIPLMFAIARMLAGRRAAATTGLLAAAMFAISPIHIQYAQEARPYAILVFGVALTLFAAIWLMSNPDRLCGSAAVSPAIRHSGRTWWVLGLLALGIALIMWSHNTGAAAVLAIGLPVLYWWLVEARRCPRGLARLALACAIALLLVLPNLAALIGHVGHMSTSWWLLPPRWWDIGVAVTRLFGTPTPEGFTACIVFLSLAAFAVSTLWQRGMRAVALLLVSVGVVPIVLEVLVSYLLLPVFLERTLIPVTVPLYIAMAYGIGRLPVAWRTTGGVVVIAILFVALGSHLRDFRKEPWHNITSYLADALRPGQPVLLMPAGVSPALEYYAVRQQVTYPRFGLPADWPEPGFARPAADALPGRKDITSADLDRVRRLIQGSQRVALLVRDGFRYDPDSLVVQEILHTHRVAESRQFRNISVTIFAAGASDDRGRRE